jgi:hypothetical protein
MMVLRIIERPIAREPSRNEVDYYPQAIQIRRYSGQRHQAPVAQIISRLDGDDPTCQQMRQG